MKLACCYDKDTHRMCSSNEQSIRLKSDILISMYSRVWMCALDLRTEKQMDLLEVVKCEDTKWLIRKFGLIGWRRIETD